MVISQGGEEETLETCLKTLYSQEAVKPVGAPCPTIYTGWSVGISNNYICLYHLYLLDQSENILYKLCALVLLGPLLPHFSELCQLGPGFPDTPWRYKCCICPPITNQAPSARGTTSKWKLDWEGQSISANEACFTTYVLVSGRIFQLFQDVPLCHHEI